MDDSYFTFESNCTLEGGEPAVDDSDVLAGLQRAGSLRIERTYSNIRESRQRSAMENASVPDDDNFEEVNLSQEEEAADQKDLNVQQRLDGMTEEQRQRVEARRRREAG